MTALRLLLSLTSVAKDLYMLLQLFRFFKHVVKIEKANTISKFFDAQYHKALRASTENLSQCPNRKLLNENF